MKQTGSSGLTYLNNVCLTLSSISKHSPILYVISTGLFPFHVFLPCASLFNILHGPFSLQLGDGLVYELVDGSNSFPHFYGPSRSFSPIPIDAVTKAEKLTFSDGQFACSFLE